MGCLLLQNICLYQRQYLWHNKFLEQEDAPFVLLAQEENHALE